MKKQSIQEKKAALQAQLAEIEIEEKNHLRQKNEVIGRAVYAEMCKDETFKGRVAEILLKNVKNKADKKLLDLEMLEIAR